METDVVCPRLREKRTGPTVLRINKSAWPLKVKRRCAAGSEKEQEMAALQKGGEDFK
jgi:hypothetical protein